MMMVYGLFQGDGKSNPVEGIVGLIAIIAAIICFDKWVIRGGKSHERHYKPDKVLRGESSSSKKFGYSILQMIEFFCGVYFCRPVRSFDEPFRKATQTEKRVGGCFMALWPLVLALVANGTGSIGDMVDSFIYGRYWMGWFYLGYVALIGSVVFFAIKIAPKIPLFISIPISLVSWPIFAWIIWKRDLI
jgi:hypothetical protein